jgi:hypothetical protein
MSNDKQNKGETGDPLASSVIGLRDLLDRGHSLFKNCEYEQSLKLFEEAAALEPLSAESHAWLAAVYGRQIEAAWSLKEKIKLLSMLEHETEVALEIDPTLPLVRRMNDARLLSTPDMLGGDPTKLPMNSDTALSKEWTRLRYGCLWLNAI